MTILTAIPGADELVGKGVYRGMPKDVPQPVRDGHAVVVGEPPECAAAARQLGAAGWKVTVVTAESDCGCGMRRECRRRVGTEVVCATGIEYLEALVLRRIDTGRIEACNASALFVLCMSTVLKGIYRRDSSRRDWRSSVHGGLAWVSHSSPGSQRHVDHLGSR